MLVRNGLLHVIGELDGLLHTFEVDAATSRAAGTEPAVVHASTGADDVVQPSHLDASPSGRLFTALIRGRDAVTFELRAATSLARLWRRSRRADARALLAGVYERIPEGFESAHLRAARALLTELD